MAYRREQNEAYSLSEQSASLGKEATKQGPMAPVLVGAITSNREIGLP